MSVYVLVGGLRRWLAGAAPRMPTASRFWLGVGFAASLAAYLGVKLAGAVFALPAAADLTLAPAGVCALGLAANGRREALVVEEAEADARRTVLAGILLIAFTTTYLVLNTVPMTTSQDETAIVAGAHEIATNGSLRIASELNDRYDTNLIGALHASYRTPTEMYHRVFPGTALLYLPFSVLPGDAGYYLSTALFGTAAIVGLYVVGLKILRSWWAALTASLVLATSPAFGHWAVTLYNNVPVLALELGALAAILWAGPARSWPFALAGMLMGLAGFMRVTELAFVVPLLGLVWWRTRSAGPCFSFAALALSGVALILGSNAFFYHDAFFFPHVGSSYIQPDSVTAISSSSDQGLFDRYFLYVIGTSGTVSNFSGVEKLDNLLFHIRYFGSSVFAFPFMAVALAGLVWRVAVGRRDAWLLLAAAVTVLAVILFLYGHQHNNYYGFGQPIARSSFVRYALPAYALLALGVAGFFLEAARLLRVPARDAALLATTLVALVGGVGMAHSYDADVYGFNRLNHDREADHAAQRATESYFDGRREAVLLLVGVNSMKLVDEGRYARTINYSILPEAEWVEQLWPVLDNALAERAVYVLTAVIQDEGQRAIEKFDEGYLSYVVLKSRHWTLYRLDGITHP